MKTTAHIRIFALISAFFIFLTIVNAQENNRVNTPKATNISRDKQSILRTGNSSVPSKFKGAKAACDTLNWYAYSNTWTLTDYYITATPPYSSGFVNGVNANNDKAKAAYFQNTGGNTYVLGGYIAFARAWSAIPAKTVTVKIWSVVAGNPGAVLGSTTLTMQQIMTDVNGNFFVDVHFNSPVLVSGSPFFMGIDFSNLDWATSHDTLSIQSNTDPETNPTAVWEMQSDGNWYQYSSTSSWQIDISLAILPFVTNVPAKASFTQSATSTCSGYPVTLNAGASVQNTVYWNLPGATPTTSSVVTPTITYANAGTFPIKLYVWGGSCDNLDSMITSITILASPIPNATATPASICPGQSSTLSASNGIAYQWTGFSPSADPNQTVTPTGMTVYTITVAGANGCSASQSVTVNVYPAPNSNATANPAAICSGSSTLLSATPGMASYLWYPGGNTNAAFTASPINNTTYSVLVTDGNGCTATGGVTVTVNPLPSPTITGTASACQNNPGNYTTEQGMTNYTWTAQGGTVTSGGSTYSASVTWQTPGTESVCTNYKDANGCSAITPVCKSVTVNPAPVPAITGNPTPCINSTGNIYTTDPGMTPYVWTVSGGTITAGSNSNTITVTWNTTGAQSVCVNFTDGNGCTAAAPTCYSVNVGCVGLEEESISNSISLFPNPANDMISVEIFSPLIRNEVVLSIYNIQDQLMLQQTLLKEKTEIDINNFANGVYIIKIGNKENTVVKRLVKE